MITRLWQGWTASEEADAYEHFLLSELFPSMREIPGFRGAEVLRRPDGGEVAFVTLTQFDSLDAIRAFARDDYEMAVIEPQALALLSHYDERALHLIPLHSTRDLRSGPLAQAQHTSIRPLRREGRVHLREGDLPGHDHVARQTDNRDRRGRLERLVALQVAALQPLADRKFDLPLSGQPCSTTTFAHCWPTSTRPWSGLLMMPAICRFTR